MRKDTKMNEKYNDNFESFTVGEGCLLTSRETAKFLNISERTLWSNTAPRGDLLALHIGRSVRYDPADISAWMEEKKGGCVNE